MTTTPDLRPAARAAPAVPPPALVRRVMEGLDRADVTWCLIRGGASDGSGDVDILVAAPDLARASGVMLREGLVRLRAYGRGSHVFFLGFDEPGAAWVEFDLVTELEFGPRTQVRSRAAAGCLARRRRADGAWALSPDDEFWALLLHCVLDKGRFPAAHAARLAELAPAATSDGPLAHALPVPAGPLYADVRDGRWWDAVASRRRILRGAWRAAPLATAMTSLRALALRRVERILQGRGRRGTSVALLGPDGCGKSTLAAGIEAAAWTPVRRVYMGLWTDAPQSRLATAWRLANRPLVVWGRYLTALAYQMLGRLVVYDRYVYDALLPPRGSLGRLLRPYLAVLGRCCPPPDLVVLLDAPGAVLHARSGEYDSAQLDAEREHYRGLASRIPHLVHVDADRSAEAVLAEVLRLIWQAQRERLSR